MSKELKRKVGRPATGQMKRWFVGTVVTEEEESLIKGFFAKHPEIRIGMLVKKMVIEYIKNRQSKE